LGAGFSPAGRLAHKHRNECQQQHQNAASYWQYDWHLVSDGFNDVLLAVLCFVIVCVV
jgi:hypothetical protein